MSGTSTPIRPSSDRTWAGLRRSAVTPAGACRSTSASRAAREARASASLRGLGPMNPASTSSATARSIGSPSTESSAHSSSAVDSQRAVATAVGRSASAASADCWSPATVRANSAQRAIRSGRSDQPPSTHSGRRCPSGATGSLPSPSSMPNRSSGPSAGIVSAARPCSRAQARPGSARHPPNSSRCAAVISQHVASRTPSAARRPAVCPDHTTHRGLSSSSAGPSAVMAPASDRMCHALSAVATPRAAAGEMTRPTRSPRVTAARLSRADSSTSGPVAANPVTEHTLPQAVRPPPSARRWPGARTTTRSAQNAGKPGNGLTA